MDAIILSSGMSCCILHSIRLHFSWDAAKYSAVHSLLYQWIEFEMAEDWLLKTDKQQLVEGCTSTLFQGL